MRVLGGICVLAHRANLTYSASMLRTARTTAAQTANLPNRARWLTSARELHRRAVPRLDLGHPFAIVPREFATASRDHSVDRRNDTAARPHDACRIRQQADVRVIHSEAVQTR